MCVLILIFFSLASFCGEFSLEYYHNIFNEKNVESLEIQQSDFKDRWGRKNNFIRPFLTLVSKQISQVLEESSKEIFSNSKKKVTCALEVGAGCGYEICFNVVRTQPDLEDFKDVKKQFNNNCYRLGINEVCEKLANKKASAPLIFSLNVFDCISEKERIIALENISKIQNDGDQLLFFMDRNPLLEKVLAEIQAEFSNYRILPYSHDGLNKEKIGLTLIAIKEYPDLSNDLLKISQSLQSKHEKPIESLPEWLKGIKSEDKLKKFLEDQFTDMVLDQKTNSNDIDLINKLLSNINISKKEYSIISVQEYFIKKLIGNLEKAGYSVSTPLYLSQFTIVNLGDNSQHNGLGCFHESYYSNRTNVLADQKGVIFRSSCNPYLRIYYTPLSDASAHGQWALKGIETPYSWIEESKKSSEEELPIGLECLFIKATKKS
jgi:hypothetical protein